MALRYDSTLLQLRAAYGYSHTQYESDDNCCFLNQTEGQNNAPYLLSKINVRTYLWVCSFSQSSSFLNWQTLVPSHNEIVKRIQQSWLSVHVNFRDTLRYWYDRQGKKSHCFFKPFSMATHTNLYSQWKSDNCCFFTFWQSRTMFVRKIALVLLLSSTIVKLKKGLTREYFFCFFYVAIVYSTVLYSVLSPRRSSRGCTTGEVKGVYRTTFLSIVS